MRTRSGKIQPRLVADEALLGGPITTKGYPEEQEEVGANVLIFNVLPFNVLQSNEFPFNVRPFNVRPLNVGATGIEPTPFTRTWVSSITAVVYFYVDWVKLRTCHYRTTKR